MSTTDTEHHEKATATALCACGAAPDGYGLPTDAAQWRTWDQWLREHIAAAVAERDERLRGIQERTEEARDLLPPESIHYSPTEDYLAHLTDDADYLLAEVARQAAVVTEREATIESERQAFSETYALQVRRTTDALAVVAAVREVADRFDETERYGGQPWGDVPVAELRRTLDGVDRQS